MLNCPNSQKGENVWNKRNYKSLLILISGSEMGVAEMIDTEKGTVCFLSLIRWQGEDATLPDLRRRKEHIGSFLPYF